MTSQYFKQFSDEIGSNSNQRYLQKLPSEVSQHKKSSIIQQVSMFQQAPCGAPDRVVMVAGSSGCDAAAQRARMAPRLHH